MNKTDKYVRELDKRFGLIWPNWVVDTLEFIDSAEITKYRLYNSSIILYYKNLTICYSKHITPFYYIIYKDKNTRRLRLVSKSIFKTQLAMNIY